MASRPPHRRSAHWRAQVVAFVITFAVMWVLHAGDHSPLVVLLVGVGAYASVVGGWFAIAAQLARRRSQIERANFAEDLAERRRRR